jgi:APA family basic amino acid/polyamine antiporter
LKLKREIGLFGTTAYILGIIIGAGIYVIIGKGAGITGNTLWLAFLIAAFIAACTGLSYAELASSFPFDSAEYLYTQRAFGERKFSFGIAWLKMITIVIASAAVALGFGGYLSRLIGLSPVLCALLLLLVLTLVNLIGVKQALWFDIAMVVVAIVGLLLVIGFGIPSIQGFDFYLESASGFSGVLTAAALIFFAFLGFEGIGNIGEEVKNPKKTLPIALILSVIISTVLYILVAIIAVSVVPWSELAHSVSPLSDVMTAIVGTKAGIMMAIMALAATGSTVLGVMIAGSRMVYGLAEEHSMPSFFLKLSKRNVPYIAVIVVALASAVFVLPGDITSVAFLTDFGALFIFMVVNLCVIALRFSHHEVPRGFRVPLNIGKFPIIPAIGLVSCAALLFSFEKMLFVGGILIFLSGIVLYTLFGHKIESKKAAAKKITEKKPAVATKAKKRTAKKKPKQAKKAAKKKS